MKFRLEIDCDNDAFMTDDNARGEEVSRLLWTACLAVRNGHAQVTLHDHNGNAVGQAHFTED